LSEPDAGLDLRLGQSRQLQAVWGRAV
jgi:hypothetical protein